MSLYLWELGFWVSCWRLLRHGSWKVRSNKKVYLIPLTASILFSQRDWASAPDKRPLERTAWRKRRSTSAAETGIVKEDKSRRVHYGDAWLCTSPWHSLNAELGRQVVRPLTGLALEALQNLHYTHDLLIRIRQAQPAMKRSRSDVTFRVLYRVTLLWFVVVTLPLITMFKGPRNDVISAQVTNHGVLRYPFTLNLYVPFFYIGFHEFYCFPTVMTFHHYTM